MPSAPWGHIVGKIMKNRLLQIGIIGSTIAAICCFTPALIIVFGAVGLSWAIGYLDVVLLPTLMIFLAITGYALWKRSRAA
ncbi:MAG: mercuric ion transport protein [Paracoccaceae bacterium]|jgi:mercuric ion transport protein